MGFRSERLKPSRDLPVSHSKIWGLDLARNQKAAVALNIAAFPMFAIFGWIFLNVASSLRPEVVSRSYLAQITPHPFVFLLIFFVVIIGIMLIHEAIHGAFFWIFTRSKPIFGLQLLFAYAGAPEWYIPRNQYAVIGLAPLVLITIAGFIVIILAPLSAGQLALIGITMNASGAVGDLYVSGKVMGQARNVLIQDTGVGFTMFGQLDSAIERSERQAEGAIDHEQ